MKVEVGIKPYWIRVGAGGLLIADKSELVRWFVEPTPQNLVQFDFANQKNDFLCGLEGYARIPGDWPEPKDGAVWEHLVPFFPQQTICDPGKTEAKPWLYVVGAHEDPWDVAEKFGQPYKGWVQLRQANWEDESGFARPAADAGLCSFISWYPGKQIKIPASWPDPAKGSPVWKSILVPSAGQVGGSRGNEEMKTHKIGPADSVVGLAKRYGVSRQDLFAANPQMHVRTDRDGFRNFSPVDFRPGKEINIPGDTGSVGEPPAQDDGTVGGCGTYGMDQFGGAVGFQRMVAKAAPKPVMAAAAKPQLSVSWDAIKPGTTVTHKQWWTYAIKETVKYNAKNGVYAYAGGLRRGPLNTGVTKQYRACAEKIVEPGGSYWIQAWLSTFAGPTALVAQLNRSFTEYDTDPVIPPAIEGQNPSDSAEHRAIKLATNAFVGSMYQQIGSVSGPYGMDQFGGTGAPTNFQRVWKKEYPQMNTAGAGGEAIITGGEGSVGWRPPWGQNRPRPWRPRPAMMPMQPTWDTPMLPYTPLTAAQFWAQQMVMAWPSNYGNPPSVWAMQNWLKGVFTGGPWSMIEWVFASAYHMNPPFPWATAYANPAHAMDARAVAKQLALNYAFSGGAVSGPAGHVDGCGCGCGTGGDGACSFTPAPNWSQNADLPDNIGHMQTMMPNWGMQYAAAPNEYFVVQGQVGAGGDDCTSSMGYAEPAKGVKYIVQKADVTDGPWRIGDRFGRGGTNYDHPALRGANSESGTATEHSAGSCNLDLVAGQPINLPLAWFLGDAPLKWKDGANYLRKYNSQSGKWDLPWSATDCPVGYAKDPSTGQCVPSATPPGPGPTTSCLPGETYLPAANICVPPGGIPPIAGNCPTGTYLDSTSGMCKIGGGGTNVDVKENGDEGWPLWVWGLLGAGAAGGILLIASAASKKKAKKPPTVGGRPVQPTGKPVPRTSASRQLTSARTSPRRSTRRPVEIIDTEGVTVR